MGLRAQEPFRLRAIKAIEGGATGSPARCGKVKAKSRTALIAHGFFRRTGEAGSDNRLRRAPSARRGPATDPDYQPSNLGLLSMPLARPHHRTVSAPTLRRLASAPSTGADLRTL